MARWRRPAHRALILGFLTASLASSGTGAGASAARDRVQSTPNVTVRNALQLCARARHKAGHVKLFVATPRVWVHGYFVRVVGNGYIVLGEPGELYDSLVPTHGSRDPLVRPGGLNIGVPSRQVPHGIPTRSWVQLHGTLRCYARAGEILFVDTWRPWHR